MSDIQATGRRKTSIARVVLKKGKGAFTINGKPHGDYVNVMELTKRVLMPFDVIEGRGEFDVFVNVQGGGIRGQADAIALGLARALEKHDPEHRVALKSKDLLTRDSRRVERKKYGQKKARKKFQFSKR